MSSLVPASNVILTVEGLCKIYGKIVAVGPLSFQVHVDSHCQNHSRQARRAKKFSPKWDATTMPGKYAVQ